MKQMQKRTCMGIVLLILTLTMTACSTETIELSTSKFSTRSDDDMLPLDETVKKQIHLKSRGSIIMPRKAKASAEEKVQIVEAYLRGEMGLKSAAAKLSVVISTMELWIALYRAEGSNAFVQAKRNRCYPPEVKEAATKEYLFGKDSILSICQKYCIRSTRSLQQWIGYCGLHISVGHLPGAGFHCVRYHAFPGSASLSGRIHRTAFRRSGKQRRQSQTAVGCAAQ